MNIYELQESPPTAIRTPTDDLGSICSGNASFSFGCRGEQIKSYFPQALQSVSHLIIAVNASNELIGFMGTEQNRLEMLFLSPTERGKGIGKQLVQYGIQ